jgi:hypothetical protein
MMVVARYDTDVQKGSRREEPGRPKATDMRKTADRRKVLFPAIKKKIEK